MDFRGFFVRVGVILAFVLTQSVAVSGVNLTQNMADSVSHPSLRTSEESVAIYELDSWIASANQDLPRNDKIKAYSRESSVNKRQDSNKISRESNTDSSNYTFAPPHLNKRTLGSENQNPIFLVQVESNSNLNAESTQDSSKDSRESATDSLDSSLRALRYAQNDEVEVDSQDSHESHDDYEIIDIGTSTIRAKTEFETYQSGNGIDRNLLDSSPSGNGDITSILKILPNVQFDTAQNRSTTPGEIDPANVSISGGLFYQNNFQLDGFNMNNDLSSNMSSISGTSAHTVWGGGKSQGLNVDTSLLESINVLDSNVNAAYGGFSGGVVEANVRKPRTDGWHGNFSYQHTSNYLTQYYIDDSQLENFYTSSNENYQPKFHKHLIRANTEGYITDDLGLVASFTTTQSFIPLSAYGSNQTGAEGQKREQKRQSYNYYIKAHYNPTETLTLEANLAYMPQDNTYFNQNAKNSYFAFKSGGWQAGLKALWQTPIGLWTNTLGYSYLQNSRQSEANYFASWRYSEGDKNWSHTNSATTGGSANEGGYGNMEQLQHSLNYKSDFAFDSVYLGKFRHTLRVGAEINYQKVERNRLNDYFSFGTAQKLTGTTCGTDSFGLDSCSTSPVAGGTNSSSKWDNGQYFKQVTVIQAGGFGFDNVAYGVFVEDEVRLDFGKGGELNARFGLRLDGDNYMDKITLAPRYAMNYISPAPIEWQSVVTFGANRYYGRNLLSYRLYANSINAAIRYTRNETNWEWANPTQTNAGLSAEFQKLNVPFSDELMGAITQNLGLFSATLKYIHRAGKDEIIMRSSSSGVYTWSNGGGSESHIISLIVQNLKPIQTYGIHHYYLFAFDYTKTQRSYNLYSSDEAYYDNKDIMYNGQIIKYRDRPVENYALPFTIRLNTTHSFDIGRTKWLLNNFFRYKAGYDRMVFINKTHPSYSATFQGDQYGKMHFKGTFGWDMRVGFEVDFYKSEAWKHTLYVNVDIYNVLNLKNMTTLSGVNGATITGFAASSSVPVYEVGRQFWLQVGYKF